MARRSLRSVLALGTIGLLVVTVLGFGVSFELAAHANRVERDELARASSEQLDANALLRAMLNQEVGLRGFLATGTRSFLEPYELGLREEPTLRGRLDAQVDPHLAGDLRAFEAAIDTWHRDVAEPELAAREAGTLTDLEGTFAAGKHAFDAIRAAHGELGQRIAASIVLAHDENARAMSAIRGVAIGLAIAVLIAGVLGTRYLLRRAVDREGEQRAIALSRFGEFVQQLTDEGELHEAVERVAAEVVEPTRTTILIRNASKNRLEVMRPEMSVDEQLQHPILTEPLRCRAVRTLREVTANATDPTVCNCALGVPASGSHLCIPMLAAGELVGVASFQSGERDHFGSDDIRQLHGYLGFAGATVSSLRLIAATRERALRDGLTGAYNRAFLGEYLAKVLSTATRRSAPLSTLMLDLDHFKRINDEHGHLAGDQAIITLARTLQRETRSADAVVRYGGEEFVVVLVDADAASASATAERIRAAVERAPVAGQGIELGAILRASVGVATFPDHAKDDSGLLAAADAALYRAKAEGRNRVVVAARA